MDVQVKAGSLVRTITERFFEIVGMIVAQSRSKLTSVLSSFNSVDVSAAGMLKLFLSSYRGHASYRGSYRGHDPIGDTAFS